MRDAGDMDEPDVIGMRIKRWRQAKGMNQVELATAIGVSRPHLTKVENGQDSLSLAKLSVLAAEMETTVGWLIGEIVIDNPASATLLRIFSELDSDDQRAILRIAHSMSRTPGGAPVSTGPPARPRHRESAVESACSETEKKIFRLPARAS